MTTTKLTLETISPIHIGDGMELRNGFDYVAYNGFTYLLNVDAILEAKEREWIASRGSIKSPGQMLALSDYQRGELFRYVLKGEPRSQKGYAEVRSFLKDVYDRPYIPGSTVKGALRTALAWAGWPEAGMRAEVGALAPNRSWAGQRLERKLFGKDPNHDLLRALHVSDLQGMEKAGQGLLLLNAQVVTRRAAGSPVELEALGGGRKFQGWLKIDDSLFTPAAERELGFNNRKHWLDELLPRTQLHSKTRIEKLAGWFESAEGNQRIAQFYRNLLQTPVGPNQAFVQIGWGAGWDGKTFGTRLQADSAFLERIIADYRLQRRPRGAALRRTGDAFPSSRRVVMQLKNNVALAAAPFGWALLTMEK